MIRVMAVEDQRMLREAVASLIDLEEDISVVAQAGDAAEALALAAHTRPDVVLVDIELPDRDGISLTPDLLSAVPGCRVLIVTTYARPGYLQRALNAGATGFVLKDTPVRDLAEAIRSVHRGQRVVDEQLAVDTVTIGANPLSPRELEVLQASRHHAPAADIAALLHLSEGTVRNHLSAAIRKLDVRTRAEAIELATQRGWW